MSTLMQELCACTDRDPSGFGRIGAKEASERLAGMQVIDVREPEEVAATGGSVPGAKVVPLSRLTDVADLAPDGRPMLVVCRSGRRSEMVCRAVARTGRDTAFNLEGGMLAWEALGLPVAPVEG